jgi:hypothetical protein
VQAVWNGSTLARAGRSPKLTLKPACPRLQCYFWSKTAKTYGVELFSILCPGAANPELRATSRAAMHGKTGIRGLQASQNSLQAWVHTGRQPFATIYVVLRFNKPFACAPTTATSVLDRVVLSRTFYVYVSEIMRRGAYKATLLLMFLLASQPNRLI